jgi:two-component system, sensor histidine kinase and response regulator
MDVQMPGMDGLQATAAIRMRESARGGHVPILAMTAHATPEDREMCLRAGMDSYVCKPVTAESLLRAVAELAPTGPVVVETARPAGELDRAALLSEVGGDTHLLRRLAGIFAQETERRLGELRAAAAEGNAVGVREAAHALKGMIGHWGKGRAFESARRLEERGRDGDPAGAVAVDALAREVSTLQEELERLLQEEAP